MNKHCQQWVWEQVNISSIISQLYRTKNKNPETNNNCANEYSLLPEKKDYHASVLCLWRRRTSYVNTAGPMFTKVWSLNLRLRLRIKWFWIWLNVLKTDTRVPTDIFHHIIFLNCSVRLHWRLVSDWHFKVSVFVFRLKMLVIIDPEVNIVNRTVNQCPSFQLSFQLTILDGTSYLYI